MFERMTERARHTVVLAQEEARALKHNYIGTEHILLGLFREEEGLACRVLESFDISVESVYAEVVRIIGRGEEKAFGQIPFTHRAKLVLDKALREALSLGHNYIGTEHILLGLVREGEDFTREQGETDAGYQILLGFGLDPQKIRDEVTRMLSGPGGRRRTAAASAASARSNPAAIASADELQISLANEGTQVTWSGKSAKLVSQQCDKARVRRHSLRDGRTVVTVEFFTPETPDEE
jgi:ATP-dependent Clp protease ATP-binding subunit ClpC